MPYVAKHYTSINGILYVEGEKIPDNLPEEKIKWLLSAGAIQKIAPVFGGDEEKPENTNPDETQTSEDAKETEDSEETGNDEEIPEIDVMDGIVQNTTESPSRKTSSKAKTKEGRSE